MRLGFSKERVKLIVIQRPTGSVFRREMLNFHQFVVIFCFPWQGYVSLHKSVRYSDLRELYLKFCKSLNYLFTKYILNLIVLNRMKSLEGKNAIVMSFAKLKELNMISLLRDTNNYKMIRVKPFTPSRVKWRCSIMSHATSFTNFEM